MIALENRRPENYRPPKSRLGKRLVKAILPKMIGNENVYLDFEGGILPQEALNSRVVLAAPTFWKMMYILMSPRMQSGETFRRGEWYIRKGSLSELVEEMYKDKDRAFFRYFLFLSNFRGLKFALKQRLFVRFFTRKVKAHYNVDSDLYETFLDKEMVYTCAFFNEAGVDLFDAQMRKLDTIVSRMKLPSGNSKILEIGCGWGSLSRRLARTRPDVQYTGLTLAVEQIERAQQLDSERLTPEQLDRVEYLCEDYLDHEVDNGDGYDGIAVIGMMEHVGLGHHETFLKKICGLLNNDRRAVIHTIIAGSSGEPTNSWIDRHIFHGGYAPSLAEIMLSVENCDCVVEDVFTYDPANYRKTIECWLENFLNEWETYRLSKLSDWSDEKSDELFRIWYFYLSAVRNMFVPDAMSFRVAHVVVKKA